MKYELWDPFDEMDEMKKEMDNIFKGFGKISFPKMKMREPLVDVIDKKKEIKVIAEIPGLNRKDIKIKIEKNKVEIKAEKKVEKEYKKKDYYKQERSYKGFYKRIDLPSEVDKKKSKIKFDKGILTLDLPKLK